MVEKYSMLYRDKAISVCVLSILKYNKDIILTIETIFTKLFPINLGVFFLYKGTIIALPWVTWIFWNYVNKDK